MLKTPVLHPPLLAALARAGHGSKVLIADGNYPVGTVPHPRAERIWANFTPGVIDGLTALRMIVDLLPIEQATFMQPQSSDPYATKGDPPIWAQYAKVLEGHCSAITRTPKPVFNDIARGEDLAVVIATAETAVFANILLTVGVVK